MTTVEKILDDAIGVLAVSNWCQSEGNVDRVTAPERKLNSVETCILGDIFISCRINGITTDVYDEEGYHYLYTGNKTDSLQEQAIKFAADVILEQHPELEVQPDDISSICWQYNDNIAQSKQDVLNVLEKARGRAAELGV